MINQPEGEIWAIIAWMIEKGQDSLEKRERRLKIVIETHNVCCDTESSTDSLRTKDTCEPREISIKNVTGLMTVLFSTRLHTSSTVKLRHLPTKNACNQIWKSKIFWWFSCKNSLLDRTRTHIFPLFSIQNLWPEKNSEIQSGFIHLQFDF